MDCILCGKCKKSCPAYTVYREELFSPRGKMLLYDEKVDENSVDFKCLFCGNCITNCPFDIDVPITFIFGDSRIELKDVSPTSNILVDTTNRNPSVIEELSKQMEIEFQEVLSVDDGVKSLFCDNNYDEIRAFKTFLESHVESNIYFTERSSYNLAKRIGFTNSFLISDLLDITILELPKNLTSYYKYLSKEEFALLGVDYSNITEKTLIDVDFNFGNNKLSFYLDTL